jgi:hypothetical protein
MIEKIAKCKVKWEKEKESGEKKRRKEEKG